MLYSKPQRCSLLPITNFSNAATELPEVLCVQNSLSLSSTICTLDWGSDYRLYWICHHLLLWSYTISHTHQITRYY